MVKSCRLYLIVAPGPDKAGLAALSEALASDDVACVLLTSKTPGSLDRDLATRLVTVAREAGVAVLVERDFEATAAIGADGVHIDADPEAYGAAREALGADAIIGAGCGTSRHDAMVLAEMGADYIAFPATAAAGDLIAWWAELFEVPCVAWAPDGSGDAPTLARAGADFIALPPDLWAEAPGQAVAHWITALNDTSDAA